MGRRIGSLEHVGDFSAVWPHRDTRPATGSKHVAKHLLRRRRPRRTWREGCQVSERRERRSSQVIAGRECRIAYQHTSGCRQVATTRSSITGSTDRTQTNLSEPATRTHGVHETNAAVRRRCIRSRKAFRLYSRRCPQATDSFHRDSGRHRAPVLRRQRL
jgi:hypothetical protein